jgi:hypothetical protein
VPVDGMVYCFHRQSGQRNWFNPVEHQQMILTQFDELPMVLFTARYQVINGGLGGGGRGGVMTAGMRHTAQAIAKHNGKLWYDNPTVPGDMFFDTLTMDHRTGKVEFAGQRLKAVLTAMPK